MDNVVCMGAVNNSSKTWHSASSKTYVVDNVVCMGAVNNSNQTWHWLM